MLMISFYWMFFGGLYVSIRVAIVSIYLLPDLIFPCLPIIHQKVRFAISPPMVRYIRKTVATMTKRPDPKRRTSKAFLAVEIWSLITTGRGIVINTPSVMMLEIPMIQT